MCFIHPNLHLSILHRNHSGPKFELIATASLSIDEASDLPHTHDLTLTTSSGQSSFGQSSSHPSTAHTTQSSSSNTTPASAASLPLFGHFCCRLAVQPDAIDTAAAVGPLTLHAKGPTRPVDGYARLQAFRLDLWDSEEASTTQQQQPRRTVEVTRDAKVRHIRGAAKPANSAADSNNGGSDCQIMADVVQLYVMEEGIVQEYTLHSNGGPAETQRWYAAIRRCIREHGLWGHVTAGGGSSAMQLAQPANGRGAFQRPSMRQRSLYDQVPILGKRAL